jgi:hypothetical protein
VTKKLAVRRRDLRGAAAVGLLLAVQAAARAAEPAAAEAAPPAPAVTVTLTLARSTLLSGVDQELAIAVDVTGPGAEHFMPVRALATVGTLEMLRPGVLGHFTTRYLPPADRFPEVALLVVELSNGVTRAHATARVALEGSTVVPFHTVSGAAVTMRVGDRLFGPVIADRQGHVEIPIEVPPGVRKGQARAVDRNGAARETEVDLQLPSFPRVLLLAPAFFEVGAFAEVTAVAVNDDGTPAAADHLTLGASAGLTHAIDAGAAGEARFLFEAPRRVGSGAVALTVTVAGALPGRADLAVPLHAGLAASLELVPAAARLVVGETAPVRVAITAQDQFGNPTAATGVGALIDGRPAPVEIAPDGAASLLIVPPATYEGRDTVEIDARLGEVTASEDLHVTGGAPTRLTLEVGTTRVVADGKQGAVLRVQAVDKNGTPTMVRGLSWETPEGRVRQVRVPRDGEYLAEYVPDRTRDPHRETVGVMASRDLRADGSVEVLAAPTRLVATARAGLFTNFGRGAGAAAFVEALAPLRVPHLRVFAGFAAGYLRSDIATTGVEKSGAAELETNQFPLLAVARAGISLPHHVEIAGDLDAGWAWAWTRLTSSRDGVTAASNGIPAVVVATADTVALGGGAEIAYPLRPGRLAVGLRYLWINLGRTSQGDEIAGNSAGLIGDLGYKLTF